MPNLSLESSHGRKDAKKSLFGSRGLGFILSEENAGVSHPHAKAVWVFSNSASVPTTSDSSPGEPGGSSLCTQDKAGLRLPPLERPAG